MEKQHLVAISEHISLREGEEVVNKQVRFRTLGDITITGGIESDADTLEKIVGEVAAARQTERGNRADDKRSETAMEDRKKEGYFLIDDSTIVIDFLRLMNLVKVQSKAQLKIIDLRKKRIMDNSYLDMELLRFTTAGSVDDGKSTLIGRLLFDSKSIFLKIS